ncbi:hypothetical protein [uncultured Paraglaciecola sp.]|uniref:hypothetical protein n=1 Tax=uncultured Paraglaciecola sp. TaxID=1765024 RepID=UPI002594D2C0|nr:hypothetical protein [uncultured Paraglaciecola sp.]
MNKHFQFKKQDEQSTKGAAKHRFNAKYSDEYDFSTKKSKNALQHRASQRRRQLSELH